MPMVGGFDKVHPLPPGGPAPRMADGHVDLTGRWYPNAAGRMLQFAYPLDPAALRQFDPKATPEEPPSFKPGMEAKYKRPVPYGDCDQAGTPSTTLEQDAQHAPMELIATPGRLVMLYEYPLDVRMVYMNGAASQGSGSHVQWRLDCSLGGRYAGSRRDRDRREDEEFRRRGRRRRMVS